MDNGKMLTAAEVARRCGVSDNTVRKWIKAGLLNPISVPGSPQRIEEAEYYRFRRELAQNTSKSEIPEVSKTHH